MSFNPDQPRDERGRFASDGGGGSSVGKSSGSGPRPVMRGPVVKLSSGHNDATQKTVEQARKYFAKESGLKGVSYRNAAGKQLNDPFARRYGKPGTLGEFVPHRGEQHFNEMQNVGHAKYVVNYHNGTEKHSDGSDFMRIKIFSNKTEKDRFVRGLKAAGYKEH